MIDVETEPNTKGWQTLQFFLLPFSSIQYWSNSLFTGTNGKGNISFDRCFVEKTSSEIYQGFVQRCLERFSLMTEDRTCKWQRVASFSSLYKLFFLFANRDNNHQNKQHFYLAAQTSCLSPSIKSWTAKRFTIISLFFSSCKRNKLLVNCQLAALRRRFEERKRNFLLTRNIKTKTLSITIVATWASRRASDRVTSPNSVAIWSIKTVIVFFRLKWNASRSICWCLFCLVLLSISWLAINVRNSGKRKNSFSPSRNSKYFEPVSLYMNSSNQPLRMFD